MGFVLMFEVQEKDGPKAKWKGVKLFATKKEAQDFVDLLDEYGCGCFRIKEKQN